MQTLTLDLTGDRTRQNRQIGLASRLRKRLVARGYAAVYSTRGASVVLRTTAPADVLKAEHDALTGGQR
jgi:hypothetical protein